MAGYSGFSCEEEDIEVKEWLNDAEHICSTCETEFKVYCVDEIPTVNFCPRCGSSQLDK